MLLIDLNFFFSSRRRHTRWTGDWSSDVCSSDLDVIRFQESVGLHAITDGEYRRSSFHADFIEKLGGARAAGRLDVEGTVSGFEIGRASCRERVEISGVAMTRKKKKW